MDTMYLKGDLGCVQKRDSRMEVGLELCVVKTKATEYGEDSKTKASSSNVCAKGCVHSGTIHRKFKGTGPGSETPQHRGVLGVLRSPWLGT